MKIAISGTPGVGKTTIAKIVAEELHYKLVDLNAFAREKELTIGRDYTRNADIVDEKRLAKHLKVLDDDLVIEGHLAHLVKADIVFVLRCNPGVLRKRLLERKWPETKIQENVDAEIMEVIPEEARKANKRVYEVDATDIPKATEELLEIVYHL